MGNRFGKVASDVLGQTKVNDRINALEARLAQLEKQVYCDPTCEEVAKFQHDSFGTKPSIYPMV